MWNWSQNVSFWVTSYPLDSESEWTDNCVVCRSCVCAKKYTYHDILTAQCMLDCLQLICLLVNMSRKLGANFWLSRENTGEYRMSKGREGTGDLRPLVCWWDPATCYVWEYHHCQHHTCVCLLSAAILNATYGAKHTCLLHTVSLSAVAAPQYCWCSGRGWVLKAFLRSCM